MKKVLSLVLCAVLLFTAIPITASAADDELNFTVASDLHLDLEYSKAEFVANENVLNEDYAHAIDGGQMHYESEAVVDAFLQKAATEKAEFVLLTGDLTDNGTQQEHIYMAEKLKNFEQTSGKKVFVIPGNHDYYDLSTTANLFKEYYADFGYAKALDIHDATASYTADINDEYRLIAIDSCNRGEVGDGVNDELMNWIALQGQKAQADGKKTIAMIHHNFMEQLYLSSVVTSSFVISDEDYDLKNLFASYDIKYIFTGHTHIQDIASYKAEDGTVIYSVLTGSINAYPCPYRSVTFGDNVDIKTKYIESIDVSNLPKGISENALYEAENNFQQYAKNYTYTGFEYRLYIFTTADKLSSLVEDEEMKQIIYKVGSRLEKAVNMPLYEKDAQVPGESIETIAKRYQTTLPATEHKTILKLLTHFYQASVQGDEDIRLYSADAIVLSRAVAAGINYTLAEVSDEEYAKALNFVLGMFGADVMPVDFLKYAGSAIKRFEGCEILVTTAILPIIGNFGTDDSPADNNATLPGYSQMVEQEKDVWDIIVEIIEKIFHILQLLLALLPEN